MNDYQNGTYGLIPIGTIIQFMGTKAPNGYLFCDGTVYNITDYQEFCNFLLDQFGSVNKFGGDGTTTFAVPDLRGEFLRCTGTNGHANQGNGSSVGTHQNNGLPNITGTIEGDGYNNTNSIFWANNGGALYTGRRYEGSVAQYSSNKGTTNRSVIGIDASRSSAFYGASSYVTPTNTSVYMCIRVK